MIFAFGGPPQWLMSCLEVCVAVVVMAVGSLIVVPVLQAACFLFGKTARSPEPEIDVPIPPFQTAWRIVALTLAVVSAVAVFANLPIQSDGSLCWRDPDRCTFEHIVGLLAMSVLTAWIPFLIGLAILVPIGAVVVRAACCSEVNDG